MKIRNLKEAILVLNDLCLVPRISFSNLDDYYLSIVFKNRIERVLDDPIMSAKLPYNLIDFYERMEEETEEEREIICWENGIGACTDCLRKTPKIYFSCKNYFPELENTMIKLLRKADYKKDWRDYVKFLVIFGEYEDNMVKELEKQFPDRKPRVRYGMLRQYIKKMEKFGFVFYKKNGFIKLIHVGMPCLNS